MNHDSERTCNDLLRCGAVDSETPVNNDRRAKCQVQRRPVWPLQRCPVWPRRVRRRHRRPNEPGQWSASDRFWPPSRQSMTNRDRCGHRRPNVDVDVRVLRTVVNSNFFKKHYMELYNFWSPFPPNVSFFSMTTSDCRTKILFVSDLLRLYVFIFIDYLQFCRIC